MASSFLTFAKEGLGLGVGNAVSLSDPAVKAFMSNIDNEPQKQAVRGAIRRNNQNVVKSLYGELNDIEVKRLSREINASVDLKDIINDFVADSSTEAVKPKIAYSGLTEIRRRLGAGNGTDDLQVLFDAFFAEHENDYDWSTKEGAMRGFEDFRESEMFVAVSGSA